jgi:hypothetical protein
MAVHVDHSGAAPGPVVGYFQLEPIKLRRPPVTM